MPGTPPACVPPLPSPHLSAGAGGTPPPLPKAIPSPGQAAPIPQPSCCDPGVSCAPDWFNPMGLNALICPPHPPPPHTQSSSADTHACKLQGWGGTYGEQHSTVPLRAQHYVWGCVPVPAEPPIPPPAPAPPGSSSSCPPPAPIPPPSPAEAPLAAPHRPHCCALKAHRFGFRGSERGRRGVAIPGGCALQSSPRGGPRAGAVPAPGAEAQLPTTIPTPFSSSNLRFADPPPRTKTPLCRMHCYTTRGPRCIHPPPPTPSNPRDPQPPIHHVPIYPIPAIPAPHSHTHPHPWGAVH